MYVLVKGGAAQVPVVSHAVDWRQAEVKPTARRWGVAAPASSVSIARRLGQFIEHNVLTQLAQVWLRSMQEHITVRHVVLQAEGETSTLTPDAWVPQPRSGLQVQIHVHH